MKFILTSLLLLTTSLSVFAKDLSKAKQKKIVENIAKEVREEFDNAGHQAVETGAPKLLTKKELIKTYLQVKEDIYAEEALSSKEISSLFRCHYSKSCALWFFGSSSDYWGGYGTYEHFILMNVKNGKSEEIRYMSYAE